MNEDNTVYPLSNLGGFEVLLFITSSDNMNILELINVPSCPNTVVSFGYIFRSTVSTS